MAARLITVIDTIIEIMLFNKIMAFHQGTYSFPDSKFPI